MINHKDLNLSLKKFEFLFILSSLTYTVMFTEIAFHLTMKYARAKKNKSKDSFDNLSGS